MTFFFLHKTHQCIINLNFTVNRLLGGPNKPKPDKLPPSSYQNPQHSNPLPSPDDDLIEKMRAFSNASLFLYQNNSLASAPSAFGLRALSGSQSRLDAPLLGAATGNGNTSMSESQVDDDDDDIVVVQKTVKISLRCPISLLRISEPVKGSICRHVDVSI